MTNPLIGKNSTPAERANGCFLSYNFRNNYEVILDGGAISGAPAIDHGITLDRVTPDYVEYNLCGQFAYADPCSYHLIFYPDFDPNEDLNVYFFDTDNAVGNYHLRKRANALGDDLLIRLGGILIALISYATYSPLWVTNGRNLFTLSGTSGATDMWFNGTQILTADATAWAATDEGALFVGASNGGANGFGGRYELLKFYNTLLTETDHKNLWLSGTY